MLADFILDCTILEESTLKDEPTKGDPPKEESELWAMHVDGEGKENYFSSDDLDCI